MSKPDFWNDRKTSEQIINESNNIKNAINIVETLTTKINNNICLLDSEIDEEILLLLNDEYNDLLNELEELKTDTYLSGEYDKNNCTLEIHAGAGGTESCDWANMLARMYTRYCEKNNYTITELSHQPGEEVGIKSILFQIKGNNAYGYLKGERGVHRLVRISPFDAGKRRHTSFASVEVTPEISNNIDIVIDEKDLKIDTYRSSGAGGQNVNKTDSAVRMTHIPTGIVVTCQNERNQIKNRETALSILKSRLYLLKQEEQKKKISSIQGEQKNIEWGSQIRSYVFCPYTMVKDHRTNYEVVDVKSVLDGNIDEFINAYLKFEVKNNENN